MNLIEIYDTLLQGEGHFTTQDVVKQTGCNAPRVSKALAHLEKLGKVTKVSRGSWALPAKINRLKLPELVSGAPTYCTAHTALSHHGMIEQIPHAIYAVTTGRGKTVKTPFGPIQLHQVSKEMFRGWRGGQGRRGGDAKIATPEKALVDYFYLGISGHPHFGNPPEVELPEGFNWDKAFRFTRNIRNQAWRHAVERKLATQRETCATIAQNDSAEM